LTCDVGRINKKENMKIEILGMGCPKCKMLYENVKKAVEEKVIYPKSCENHLLGGASLISLNLNREMPISLSLNRGLVNAGHYRRYSKQFE